MKMLLIAIGFGGVVLPTTTPRNRQEIAHWGNQQVHGGVDAMGALLIGSLFTLDGPDSPMPPARQGFQFGLRRRQILTGIIDKICWSCVLGRYRIMGWAPNRLGPRPANQSAYCRDSNGVPRVWLAAGLLSACSGRRGS